MGVQWEPPEPCSESLDCLLLSRVRSIVGRTRSENNGQPQRVILTILLVADMVEGATGSLGWIPLLCTEKGPDEALGMCAVYNTAYTCTILFLTTSFTTDARLTSLTSIISPVP